MSNHPGQLHKEPEIMLTVAGYEELVRAAERGDALRALIASDAFAISFQSMGQYRTALLKESK